MSVYFHRATLDNSVSVHRLNEKREMDYFEIIQNDPSSKYVVLAGLVLDVFFTVVEIGSNFYFDSCQFHVKSMISGQALYVNWLGPSVKIANSRNKRGICNVTSFLRLYDTVG